MTGGAWLCLLAPLVGTILILLGGSWLPRKFAAWTATTSVFVAFGGAIWAFLGVHAQPVPGNTLSSTIAQNYAGAPARGEITTAWTWLQAGNFKRRARSSSSTR